MKIATPADTKIAKQLNFVKSQIESTDCELAFKVFHENITEGLKKFSADETDEVKFTI